MMISPIGIGPLGPSEWNVGTVTGTPSVGSPVSVSSSSNSNSGSFSNALSNAISSLDSTQTSADAAAQNLATGKATDPTQAVTAMENAALAMDYAAQIRNQLDTAATTLFQTQV